MGRPKKEAAPEESPGAPLWMVTFSDCMNLLLTFFVLLVTFSSFGEENQSKLPALGAAMRNVFGTPSPGGGVLDQSSVAPQQQIMSTNQPEFGSDKPTGASSSQRGTLKNDMEIADYHNHKVFLIPSRKVFLGKGVVLSPDGRYLLAVMAAFLRNVPSQVVISENAPGQPDSDLEAGLSRAMAVLRFLVQTQGLDQQRFHISGDTTMALDGAGATTPRPSENERTLEIVLLDRSVQQ